MIMTMMMTITISQCAGSSCPGLAAPRHGRLVPVQCQLKRGDGQDAWLTPSTVCSYRCRRGYRLTGHAYRTCLDNGTWTGQPAVCSRKSLSLFLSLCRVSVCVCLCLLLCLSLSVSVSFFVSVSFSVSISISVSLYVGA